MSLPHRPLSSNIRPHGSAANSSTQSPALVARVNEKRIELDNLTQLRDLSANLAAQMQALEQKMSTLADGTEAIATVLANWHNVLRAIHMASMKIPKPKDLDATEEEKQVAAEDALPQTLVRIPLQQPEPE